MKALFLTLLLVGCGVHEENRRSKFHFQDVEVSEFVDTFEANYGIEVKNKIEITFGETVTEKHPRAIGLCYYSGDGNFIVLNKQFWENSDYYQKESLVYHELGHCVFNRSHSEEMMDDEEYGSVPKSIMYPSVIGGREVYIARHEHYVRELYVEFQTTFNFAETGKVICE